MALSSVVAQFLAVLGGPQTHRDCQVENFAQIEKFKINQSVNQVILYSTKTREFSHTCASIEQRCLEVLAKRRGQIWPP